MRFSALTRGAALSSALTLCCAGAAQAAGGGSPAAESTPLQLPGSGPVHAAAPGGGSSIVRTIIALVVVIAIIYAVARILRAVKGGAVRATGSGLTQLATLPLGPGRSVALVRAGSDIVLVGVAEHGVTALKTYTEAEALATGIELPVAAQETYGVTERPFDRVLDGLRRITVRS